MRAAEVLNHYAKGKRNFQDLDLRERNFKNCDLRGINFSNTNLEKSNFSGANLRGAVFSDAILRNANLTGIQCGLQFYWLFIFWLSALLTSAYIGFTANLFYKQENTDLWRSITIFISVIVLLFLKLPKHYKWKDSVIPILFFAISPGFLVYLGLGPLSASLLGTFLVSILLRILRIELGQRRYSYIAFLTIFIVILFAILLYHFDVLQTTESWLTFALQPLFIGALINGTVPRPKALTKLLTDSSFIFSTYAGIGTNFKAADLTNANFSNANLLHASMQGSINVRTNWLGAKCLEYSASDSLLLKDIEIRRLMISGDGQNQNFDGKIYVVPTL